MLRKILYSLGVVVGAAVLYLAAWPVPVDPAAWEAPPNPGYSGPFATNERLKGLETFAIGDNTGPEDIAFDADGRIYAPTHQGRIVRLEADGSNPENWANTGGRPLGIDFDGAGNLIVADAYRGLLSIAPDASITVLATEADGRSSMPTTSTWRRTARSISPTPPQSSAPSDGRAPTRPPCST